jgi:uncharacterized HAD superfamily protein
MLSVRSICDMAQVIAVNLHRIDRSQFDVVVGIPRSGMIPAAMIATHLQLPLADVVGYGKGIVHGRSGEPAPMGKRVLLVDDSCNKGRAMARAVSLLPKGTKITRLAVFGPYQVEPSSVCDLWFEVVHGPRAFAWNMQKHIRLPRWGFDFDGVLCRDNTKEENDDGPRYAKFLRDVEPLFIPQRPIGHIVTGRLERYRPETEAWLARHGIQFEALHMTPFHSKAERMQAMKFAGGRGGWKARLVKDLGVEFFMESCPKQASIIAREVGIPVWCTRTQALA